MRYVDHSAAARICAPLVVCALSACGGGGSSTAPPAPPVHAGLSDPEIAQILYTDSRRTPEGFYADAAPGGADYVATLHLKNTDLPAPSTPRHELCTDDWNQALDWSESAASRASVYADLTATYSNDRYFEFDRVPRDQPQTLVRARVYRCAYLDRDAVDLDQPTGAAGAFNRRPLTAAELQQLSEYLWLFTPANNFGYAVLESNPASATDHLEQRLLQASLERSSVANGCDRIALENWIHSVDLTTGELTLRREAVRSFGARWIDGGVQSCTF